MLHERREKPPRRARRAAGHGPRPLDEPQAVLQLGDAQLQLVQLVARDEAEPRGQVLQALPRPLAEPCRVAPPAGQRVLEQLPGVVAAHAATLAQLSGELVEPLRRQGDRADRGQREPFEQIPSGLGHGDANCAAAGGARASTAPSRPRRRRPRAGATTARARARTAPRVLGTLEAELLGRFGRNAADALRDDVLVRSPPEVGVALHQHGQERRRDEERRDGAEADADEEREREVLQRVAAEEQEAPDRQQRDERRRQLSAGPSPTARRSRSSRTSPAASAACSRAPGRRR